MRIISRMRKQKAWYWAHSAVDAYGRQTYSTPVKIDVRWEDSLKEIIGDSGEMIVSQGTVYVDRDVEVGEALKLTTAESTTPTGTPESNGASIIKRFENLPDFKAKDFLKTAYI